MKLLIAVLAVFASSQAFANPYIEYKNELKYTDSTYKKTISHIRLGYKTKNNFYFEAGKRTEGTSGEIGYKIKRKNWVLKGKWEASHTDALDHKLETEIRYTLPN